MAAADDAAELSNDADLQSEFFDVATFINRRFPDEAALISDLDPYVLGLRDSIARIDSQLASKVREHRQSGISSAASANASITSLESLTRALEALTEASTLAEKATLEAVAPARPYSIALENACAASSALESLVTLSDAVTKLEEASKSKNLKLLAEDPAMFPNISEALETFKQIPFSRPGPALRRLPELRARAEAASAAIREVLVSEFRLLSDIVTLSVGGDAAVPDSARAAGQLSEACDRLRTACSVASAMGGDVPGEVIGAHVRNRMLAFRTAFEMDKSGLAGIEKRFAWIRRELRSNWPVLAGERSNRGWGLIFPDVWDVAWRLTNAAMREISEWVSNILRNGADRDVVALVGALSKAKEFETELDRRFSRAIQISEGQAGVISGDAPRQFMGTLSRCFGPYMGTYVAQEDEHLRVIILDILRAETWTHGDGGVLKSSTDLFLTIKKSMRTCAALDCRQPLFSLHKVFKRHLDFYATELSRRTPAPFRDSSANLTGINASAVETSNTMKAHEFTSRLQLACALVATAEYCAVTIGQLQENLREIVEEAYAEGISLENEQERFSGVSASCLRALVSIVCADLELSLRSMSDRNWADWSEVGDSSPYVEEVANKLATVMPMLSTRLSKPHLRFFLERLVAVFIPIYVSYLYSCQGMSDAAGQQLLLDAAALKGHLLRMPSLAKAQAPPTYVKYVNREMGKGEAILKVVLSEPEMTVKTYAALIPDGSAVELQRILDMKGLRRADAASIVLQYTRIAGPKRGLTRKEESPSENSVDARDESSVTIGPSLPAVSTAGPLGAIAGAIRTSAEPVHGGTTADVGVESVRALFRGLESSWGSIKDAGIADRLGQTAGRINESFESTAEQVKRRFAK